MEYLVMKIEKLLSVIAITIILIASLCVCVVNKTAFLGRHEDTPSQSPSDIVNTSFSDINEPDKNTGESPVTEKMVRHFIKVTENAYIRSKGNLKSEKIGLLKKGAEYEITDENGNFYKIKYTEYDEGWISKSCCERFSREITVYHVPDTVLKTPFNMNGTVEGDRLREFLHKYKAVGASVALIKDGRVAYHYEYGYADKANQTWVTQDTKFRVASISKVFTTMLAMSEVDSGKLDLDGDLSDLFGYKIVNPNYPKEKISMRMLLTHTSGFTGENVTYGVIPLYSLASDAKYYSSMPGMRFTYSNLGMGIAGAAVEKASQQTISAYARDVFFVPMGIDASYDGKYLSEKSLVANCYQNGILSRSWEKLTVSNEKESIKPGETYHLGQGGLLISAVDLARVSTILLNNGTYNDKRYLSEKSLKEMMSVYSDKTGGNYKQCLAIRKSKALIKGREMYYHNGTYYGVLALLAIDPTDRSGVVIITSGANSGRRDNTLFDVCDDILNYCYNQIL